MENTSELVDEEQERREKAKLDLIKQFGVNEDHFTQWPDEMEPKKPKPLPPMNKWQLAEYEATQEAKRKKQEKEAQEKIERARKKEEMRRARLKKQGITEISEVGRPS